MRARCQVADCDNPVHGHGYCNSHYRRWIRHGDPLITTKPYYGLGFWDRVDQSGEHCWLWLGTRGPDGYGRIYGLQYGLGQRGVLAHRVSWLLTYGHLDPDVCVLHRCDNPPCVRPDHLFLGTRADNSADMIQKGRDKFNDNRTFVSFTHGEKNGVAKLTEVKVVEMRQRAMRGEHYTDLAKNYGISATRANAIILGNGWRHVWPFFDPASGKHRPEAIPRKKRTIKSKQDVRSNIGDSKTG